MLSVEVSKAWLLNPNVLRYRHGMVQPGLLIVNDLGEVIYSWASTAKVTNMFGTFNRPKPKDVWALVKPTLMFGIYDDDTVKIRKHGMLHVLKWS